MVGSGRADKAQIARMVAGLVGLRTPPRADAADALAVAITHGFRSREGVRGCRAHSAAATASTAAASSSQPRTERLTTRAWAP